MKFHRDTKEFMAVMFSRVHTHVRSHQIVPFKCVAVYYVSVVSQEVIYGVWEILG